MVSQEKESGKGELMIKLYIGGSPCTHWSIAQTKNRETEPSGLGWELFENYVIGLKKYKPDYFLYENNKSMSPAIREQITKELGVEPILINSSLVSAQNRNRLYWSNIPGITQPEDKGILLRDILETGTAWREKSYTLDANYYKTAGTYDPTSQHSYSRHMAAEPVYPFGTNDAGKAHCLDANYWKGSLPEGTLEKHRRSLVAIPCAARQVGRRVGEDGKRHDYDESIDLCQRIEINENPDKTNCLTSVQKDNLVIISCETEELSDQYYHGDKDTNVFGKIKCKNTGDNKGQPSQGTRIYRTDSKCICLDGDSRKYIVDEYKENITDINGKKITIYEVLNGQITIKGKQYPIKLQDGFYIIRKLTVTECKRLQTVPDTYIFPVSDSQAYKQLGNGWTVDVIAHQLSFIPGISTEEIEVMSMYDGMSCGHIALDKLGANVVRYYATEIDKYAIQTAKHNYPMMEHIGDAYQVRDNGWRFTSNDGKAYDTDKYIGQMTVDEWLATS